MDKFILHCFEDGLVTQQEITDRRVLEVGSRNVNGSVRSIITSRLPKSYTGVDIEHGPGVDRLVRCENLVTTFGTGNFDVVICTEMLEHVKDWELCLRNLVRMMAPNGVLALTTRSPGFPIHNHPNDYWRFTREHMLTCMAILGVEVQFMLDDIQYPGIIMKAVNSDKWNPTNLDLPNAILV